MTGGFSALPRVFGCLSGPKHIPPQEQAALFQCLLLSTNSSSESPERSQGACPPKLGRVFRRLGRLGVASVLGSAGRRHSQSHRKAFRSEDLPVPPCETSWLELASVSATCSDTVAWSHGRPSSCQPSSLYGLLIMLNAYMQILFCHANTASDEKPTKVPSGTISAKTLLQGLVTHRSLTITTKHETSIRSSRAVSRAYSKSRIRSRLAVSGQHHSHHGRMQMHV